jgi:hypothetical protein
MHERSARSTPSLRLLRLSASSGNGRSLPRMPLSRCSRLPTPLTLVLDASIFLTTLTASTTSPVLASTMRTSMPMLSAALPVCTRMPPMSTPRALSLPPAFASETTTSNT